MSSTGIDSDPAQPGQAPPTSQGDIEQLSEEILLQRAILNSLNELPSDPYTRLQIEEATAQLRRLKNRLSAARQAQSQQSGTTLCCLGYIIVTDPSLSQPAQNSLLPPTPVPT